MEKIYPEKEIRYMATLDWDLMKFIERKYGREHRIAFEASLKTLLWIYFSVDHRCDEELK